ncbi:class I SAM-dependent methyltransferase [Candidatus Neomarinimicrobiota bacterium]
MKMTRMQKRFVNRQEKAKDQIAKVRQHLERPGMDTIHDVLELGCGIGVVTGWLAEAYSMNVHGTDVDPEQIETARQLQPETDRLHFSVEDAAHVSFDEASFDLVLSQFVFHHMADWAGVVGEAARVLRPGGYFMWLDVAFKKTTKRVISPFMKNFGIYTIEDARTAFETQGLVELHFESFKLGPFTFYDMLLQKPEEIQA